MPFLFFLGLLATGAAVSSMVDLSGDSDAARDGDNDADTGSAQDGPDDAQGDVDPHWYLGEEDADEVLGGTDDADTIVGNQGDADTLEGAGGNDTLFVAHGNQATGGAGADTFVMQAEDHQFGEVQDFDPSEDVLVLRDFVNPEDGSTGGLILTQEDDGLALRNEETGEMYLALPGATLEEGESLSVLFQYTDHGQYDSNVEAEFTRSFHIQEAPFPTDALRGTSDADTIVGGDADNRIFGEGGADLLRGGDGNDQIFGGSGSVFYDSEWNHQPGHLNRLGVDDTLRGGDGNDVLWLGAGNEASGGDDSDTFYAFAGVYDTASEITDFAAGEDQLIINFGLDGAHFDSYQNAENEYFSVAEAAAGFEMSYDPDSNQTTITLGSHPLLILNGDQTDLSVAFSNQHFAENYGDDDDYEYLDINGAPVDAEAAQSADILFSGMNPQDMYDANGNGGLVA